MQDTDPSTRGQALPHLRAFAELASVSLACFAAGAALGVALGVRARRRDLAWTWSAFAPGAALALTGLLIVTGVERAVGAPIAALAWGVGAGMLGYSADRDLQDRRAGADREIALRAQRRPLDQLRRRRAQRAGRGEQVLADGIPLGRTARGVLACVPRGSAESGAHVLIPGATGAGKTTSLAALVVEYVARSGFGAVVLEAKSDDALLAAALAAAKTRGARLHLVSPTGPCGYDPLARGSVDERSERLVAAQAWGSEDADFYRQAASPFLRLVLRVLDVAGEPPTLASVARHCQPDGLDNYASDLGAPALAEEVATALAAIGADERRAIAGLRARLANLATSDFAREWLDPGRAGIPCVDLRAAIERREVAYLRLDTDRTGNVGRAVAQMALLDLGAAASSMIGRGVGTFVAIDEYGALEAPALERLYTRGRAAGFSVALGTQTLADLRAAGPAVRERVGATVSALICHRIGGQEDAEWIAQAIGTVPTWETTTRTDRIGRPTDEGTRTRGYRFEVNPSELQRLGRGEAVVAQLQQAGSSRSARAKVVPAWERLPTPPSLPTIKDVGLPEPEQGGTMNSMNLTASLTGDPELSQHGETTVCEMRVVELNGGDSPLSITVAAFGRQAENCAKYLKQGRNIAVQGRLRLREWEGSDGPRSAYTIAAFMVEFLPGGARSDSEPADPPAQASGPSGEEGTADIDLVDV